MKKQNMINEIKIIPALFFLSMLVSGLQAQTLKYVFSNTKQGIHVENDGETTLYVFSNSKQGLNVEYNGKIAFEPDERSIKAISDGGYLRIEKTTPANSRELLIKSTGNSLNYEYREDGIIKPYEPDGKAWLSEILPELIKTTSIAAESRVDQLYATGGISEVVKALPELEGDLVRAAYLKLLLDKKIKEEDISTIINVVGSQVQSDHYRFEIFKKLFPENTATSEDLFKAVEFIDSDHYKSQLIEPYVVSLLIAGQQQNASRLLRTVSSDHYKYHIIQGLGSRSLSADALKGVLKVAMAEIDSDHYKSELLESLLKSGNMNEERLLILIDNAQHVGSEHYKAGFLQAVCNTNPKEKVMDNLRVTAKSIQSPHFYGEVMRCLNSGK
ncbi:hypothetical protein ACFS7Z_26180 [Pontibacter toksunensis]|uniref:HEAT repeat domain-containing protein n=1 Tax=Pontibacter toksunensis TaxID=1332631 RepID=A0ABW6C1Z1_9BACT